MCIRMRDTFRKLGGFPERSSLTDTGGSAPKLLHLTWKLYSGAARGQCGGFPTRSSYHYACHYCYARATHAYFGLNADEDFEQTIFVKTNLPDVLRKELAKPSWTGERVAIGTATDAYQPCEGRYRITRRALEAMRDYRNGLSIVTKSTLVQ